MELSAIEAELARRDRLARIAPPFRPLLEPSEYKGVYGGRGQGKSHVLGELLLHYCQMRPIRAVCVREHQVSLKQSVKRLLEDKIKEFKLEHLFNVRAYDIEAPRGGLIMFQGMKNHTADSIKSLEGVDIAWVEEAQSFSARSLELLRPTIRKEGSEIWFSWNPESDEDPVDKFLRVNPPKGAIVVTSTYRDNPYVTSKILDEAQRELERNPESYAHVWLGGYNTKSNSRVFQNWKVEPFDTPDDAMLHFGADWGYSVDPSVLVRCWIKGRTLYVDYEAYQVGCEIDRLPALFDTVPKACAWETIADSARPETISYLNRHGYPRMVSAKKGPDSVKEGIIFLQGFDIVVHPRCVHVADELAKYSYVVEKKTDVVTPLLSDKKNHTIDSLRYAVEKLRKPKEFAVW